MVSTYVPNSVSRKIILAGTEARRGAGAVPTYRWRGELEIAKTRDLVRAEESTGTRDPFVSPQHGIPDLSGNYSESLTYESLSHHMRYGLISGDPAVPDANTVIAYTRDHAAGDVLDSVALEHGFPGLGWESVGVLHNEWTLTWDFDDSDGVWKFSSTLLPGSKDALPGTFTGLATGGVVGSEDTTLQSTGAAWTVDEYAGAWVTIYGGTGYGQQRQVVSNTADTLTVSAVWDVNPDATTLFRVEGLFEAGIPNASGEKISTPGTRVFVDALGLPIGSTQILERMVSGNISVNNQLAPKWFAENEENPSDKIDEGYRIVTGQLTMEFDRRDEYEQMMALDEVAIRFEKDGPVIDETAGTRYQAQVDVVRAAWENMSMQTRQNNITATFGFLAYLPMSNPILNVRTVTPLAQLG